MGSGLCALILGVVDVRLLRVGMLLCKVVESKEGTMMILVTWGKKTTILCWRSDDSSGDSFPNFTSTHRSILLE